MTTFSLMDVSVQLLKYSVNVSTTLCKNSITKRGGTEKKMKEQQWLNNKQILYISFCVIQPLRPSTLHAKVLIWQSVNLSPKQSERSVQKSPETTKTTCISFSNKPNTPLQNIHQKAYCIRQEMLFSSNLKAYFYH